MSNRVYFPNLNGLRFFAAFLVIVHHVEMTKHWVGLPNLYNTSFIGGMFGKLGIILFFVLSGFLITYLLLEEHRVAGKISVKNFYIRRLLRIWPLYYLVVILGLYILPNIPFFSISGYTEHINNNLLEKSLLFLTFFPDVAYTLYPHIPYSAQTWSVGVEEQFYFIWPVLMYFAIRRNKVLTTLIITIVVYLLIKTTTVYLYISDINNLRAQQLWLFWDHFSIDCMAIGGIGAYLLYHKKIRVLNVLYHKYTQWLIYGVLFVLTVKGLTIPWYNNELLAILFLVLILNMATNTRTLFTLEYRPLNYLGKISYGLYMYHNIILILIMKCIFYFQWFDITTFAGGLTFHVLSLGGSIVVSALSYEYFEKRFIRTKVKYSSVVSGDNANADEQAVLPAKPVITVAHKAQTA